MLSQPTSSNLSEALINVKKIEKNFLNREFTFLDRDRNKIRANVDRHMETFLQLTRRRHEAWYRHDKHFREGLRKEKDRHEKRKDRTRRKLLFDSNPDYIPRVHSPFQPLTSESVILPLTSESIIEPSTNENVIELPTNENVIEPPTNESLVLPPIVPTKINLPSTDVTPRPEAMTKVQRRTYQVLQESQKLLDESAGRSRFKFEHDSRTSTTFIHRKSTPAPTSSSCSFNSATLTVPMITSSDCEEYDRLMAESLQRETFSEFVDHFVKFRPEYRERFGLIHEASKRQQAMEKLRAYNQVHAKVKDNRYHNLIDSLTVLPLEQKEKRY